jgi:YD repeat-containing protein
MPPITETDAAGRTTTRTWDALNRMLSEVHVQAGRPTLSLGFTYDQGTHGLGSRAHPRVRTVFPGS